MKPSSRRALSLAVAFVAVAPLVEAHPGHDGHDFTWDFGHLAAYPDATILWLGVLGFAAWAVWKVVTARAEAPKEVRVRSAEQERKS